MIYQLCCIAPFRIIAQKKQRSPEEATTNEIATSGEGIEGAATKQPDTPCSEKKVMTFIERIRERATFIPDIPGHAIEGENCENSSTSIVSPISRGFFLGYSF